MKQERQPDWDRIKTIALSLELSGIEEAVSMRQPVLKAHGKLWVWWSPHEDPVVFKVPIDECEFLMEAEPETFFITPHYRGHDMVLARPERVDPDWVRANLRRVWRELAPKRLLKTLDAEQTSTGCKPLSKARPEPSGLQAYIDKQSLTDRAVCIVLREVIDRGLANAESKIWHAHPVWFLDGNPIVGFSKLKGSIRLLFWSGQSFDEDGLKPEGKFKATEVRYTSKSQIDKAALMRWLEKSRAIQWNYKNIVKRKGRLHRLN